MRIVVSGASGLIGSALTPLLRSYGHEVIALVRRAARGPDESSWDPRAGIIDADLVASADAVVNLAGASIGDKRLTASYKQVVLNSRLDSTHTIAGAIAKAAKPPALMQGSSMGYYGDAGTSALPETAPSGEGFLADVCVQWEAAAQQARDAGSRVVNLRTGLVLASHGGFAARLLPLIKLGLFGGFGSGKAIQSWITLEDHVRAVAHLLGAAPADQGATTGAQVSGAANLIAPHPVSDAEIMAALAKAMGRPRGPKIPAALIKLAVGEAAEDLLTSQPGVPATLSGSRFEWRHPTIDAAARYVARER